MSEFNQETKSETTLDNFKEELWNTVVKFEEPVLMGTGLYEKARKELLSKMAKLKETRQKTKDDECKDGSTLKKKTDDKMIKVKGEDKIKTSNMIISNNIPKARAGGRQVLEGSDRDGEIESVMIVTTPPSKGMKSRKRKREMEELSSPSVDAVSEKNLRETASMILARWKTTAYKGSFEPRRLAEIVKEIEVSSSLATDEDFKPQKTGSKKGSTNGQTWEVHMGREWITSEHQAIGKQVSNDPLEKNATRNTARPWWVALETMKELEDCLKKLDQGVSRKRRNWTTQQKAEVNKLELGSQLKRTWLSLLRDYFEEAMRTPSSALPLMANPFVRTAGQLMFAWSLVGTELEVLTSCDKLKLGKKKARNLSDAGTTRRERQLRSESGEKKRCHLFLEVDNVRNDQ